MKSSTIRKNNLKNLIEEEIRKGGIYDLPEKSELITSYIAGDQTLPPIKLYFDNGRNSSKQPLVDIQLTINPEELMHNCECHKMAALCFFEWTRDGKFKQAPVIKQLPDIKYLVLGLVEDMHVSD